MWNSLFIIGEIVLLLFLVNQAFLKQNSKQ